MIKNVLFVLALVAASASSWAAEDITIQSYVDALQEKGYTLGKKQDKMYQFLMASDGFGIQVNGAMIEIYEYDTSIKSGKDALAKIKEEGFMGKAVVTNKNLALMKNKKHANWAELKELFLSI